MSDDPTPKVLAFVEYYLPGYRAGGPIRTVANIVEHLGSEYRFQIVTRDRDLASEVPYEGFAWNRWIDHGKARHRYLTPQQCGLGNLRGLIASTSHDVLYLNSLFSPDFTFKPLLLRRLRRIPLRPTIVAPRGELAPGALQQKPGRKRAFLALTRWSGLYRDVIWQASGEHERDDIRRVFGSRASIEIAIDLAMGASSVATPDGTGRVPKRAGELRLLFLSRISPMKNLAQAIEWLADLRGTVRFDIYGPIDDAAYWQQCEQRITALPGNVRASYRGEIPHERVLEVMQAHDLFFLPTLGENFGHVIQEALLAGSPVLISDRTQWRDLESENVGWDLPLENPVAFKEVLQRCVDMDAPAHERLALRAREYGAARCHDASAIEQNRTLFRKATGRHA